MDDYYERKMLRRDYSPACVVLAIIVMAACLIFSRVLTTLEQATSVQATVTPETR